MEGDTPWGGHPCPDAPLAPFSSRDSCGMKGKKEGPNGMEMLRFTKVRGAGCHPVPGVSHHHPWVLPRS